MSADHIAKLSLYIETLQAHEPPVPRKDDKPISDDIGSCEWFSRIIREDFRPTVGGERPASIKATIDIAYCKKKYLLEAGAMTLARKWEEIGWRITEVAIDPFGLDTVILDGMPDLTNCCHWQ